ncbi:hypothetical protein [Rubripirellula reticaptiva]|uniref:Uncharacterized protein n=1 Tax=Rubripirellula reticaptiva TaxID=2528013 RepID=A0A5C6EN16_9BACT|nr:hypothetical protein [Rubripirellula reticaptiva]TWU49800.1 hypothetical protein Poly59_44250 [Rubripirellula reticaptiva]
MSVAKPKLENSKRQTKQLIMVGLLSVGLVIAILAQPSGPEGSACRQTIDASVGTTLAGVSAVPMSVHQVAPAPMDFSAMTLLPKTGLATIAERRLFVPPKPLDTQPTRDSAATVQAVYGSRSKHAALMGKMIVKNGQTLNNGAAVATVTANGVHLQSTNPKTLGGQ